MPYTDTLYYRLLEGVKSRIITLNSTDPSGLSLASRVYTDIVPDENQVIYPCAFITVADEQEQDWNGTTEYTLHWYPVRVFLADRQGRKRDDERQGRYLAWRKHIVDSFHDQIFPNNVAEVQWCTVTYGKIFDQKLPYYQYIVTGFTLKFLVRETRTNPVFPS